MNRDYKAIAKENSFIVKMDSSGAWEAIEVDGDMAGTGPTRDDAIADLLQQISELDSELKARTKMTDLRIMVLAELADRYTGLADNYRMYVQSANNKTLRRVLDLARVDAAGSEIMSALGAVELDEG